LEHASQQDPDFLNVFMQQLMPKLNTNSAITMPIKNQAIIPNAKIVVVPDLKHDHEIESPLSNEEYEAKL
jgi:hypothetical protein